MITTIETLLEDYARYSFMEGTIDEATREHLIQDVQNYVSQLKEMNLVSINER